MAPQRHVEIKRQSPPVSGIVTRSGSSQGSIAPLSALPRRPLIGPDGLVPNVLRRRLVTGDLVGGNVEQPDQAMEGQQFPHEGHCQPFTLSRSLGPSLDVSRSVAGSLCLRVVAVALLLTDMSITTVYRLSPRTAKRDAKLG